MKRMSQVWMTLEVKARVRLVFLVLAFLRSDIKLPVPL